MALSERHLPYDVTVDPKTAMIFGIVRPAFMPDSEALYTSLFANLLAILSIL